MGPSLPIFHMIKIPNRFGIAVRRSRQVLPDHKLPIPQEHRPFSILAELGAKTGGIDRRAVMASGQDLGFPGGAVAEIALVGQGIGGESRGAVLVLPHGEMGLEGKPFAVAAVSYKSTPYLEIRLRESPEIYRLYRYHAGDVFYQLPNQLSLGGPVSIGCRQVTPFSACSIYYLESQGVTLLNREVSHSNQNIRVYLIGSTFSIVFLALLLMPLEWAWYFWKES